MSWFTLQRVAGSDFFWQLPLTDRMRSVIVPVSHCFLCSLLPSWSMSATPGEKEKVAMEEEAAEWIEEQDEEEEAAGREGWWGGK